MPPVRTPAATGECSNSATSRRASVSIRFRPVILRRQIDPKQRHSHARRSRVLRLCARASPHSIPAPVSSMTLIATCAPSRTPSRMRDPPVSPLSAAAICPACNAAPAPVRRPGTRSPQPRPWIGEHCQVRRDGEGRLLATRRTIAEGSTKAMPSPSAADPGPRASRSPPATGARSASRLPQSRSRTAISRRRAAARASSRLPTFAQASRSTSVTAKNSSENTITGPFFRPRATIHAVLVSRTAPPCSSLCCSSKRPSSSPSSASA